METPLETQVDQLVRKYLDEQKQDIFSNFRTFARYDRDIQFFLRKIMDELSVELNNYRDTTISDFKEKTKQYKLDYKKETDDAIHSINRYLDSRIKKITAQPPYDAISQNFLIEQGAKIRAQIKEEYGDKIEFLQVTCFLLFVGICFLFWLKYF